MSTNPGQEPKAYRCQDCGQWVWDGVCSCATPGRALRQNLSQRLLSAPHQRPRAFIRKRVRSGFQRRQSQPAESTLISVVSDDWSRDRRISTDIRAAVEELSGELGEVRTEAPVASWSKSAERPAPKRRAPTRITAPKPLTTTAAEAPERRAPAPRCAQAQHATTEIPMYELLAAAQPAVLQRRRWWPAMLVLLVAGGVVAGVVAFAQTLS